MKNNLYAFGTLVSLFAIFFVDNWINNKEYVSADTATARVNGQVLEALNRPNWNPTIFCGMPSFESLQYTTGVYFPHYVLQFFGKFYIVIYFAFGAFGIFLICRYLNLSELASLGAAAFFGLSPWLIGNYAYGHGSQIMSAMFIPCAFLFTLKICKFAYEKVIRSTLFAVGVLALILGLQLQRGHVQIAYYTLLLCGATVVFFAIRHKEWKWLLYFSIATGLALLLAANLYYPVHYYKEFSIRGSSAMSLDYASNWSLHPAEIITFILPDYYGFGGRTYTGHFTFTDFPYFFGIVPLGLACYALWQHRRDPIMLWIGSVALFSLGVAMGHFTPIYGLLYNWLPYFKSFRVPTMIIILTYFSVAILFGAGLYAVEKKYSFGKLWSGLLIASAVIMLWLVDSRIGHKEFAQKIETNEAIEDFQLGKLRVHPVGNLFASNIWGILGLESTGGYHAAKLANYQKFLELTKAEINISPFFLALTGSNFVISPTPLKTNHLEPVDTLQTSGTASADESLCYVYRNRFRADRVYLVGKVEQATWDKLSMFSPTQLAVINEPVNFNIEPDSTAGYRINQYDPELVSISVKCQKGQLLVLNDVFYPGWHSYLDGSEVRTYEVNYCFRGVYVPAGEHTIVFKYHKIVEYSKWISYGALVVILGLVVQGWYAGRKR